MRCEPASAGVVRRRPSPPLANRPMTGGTDMAELGWVDTHGGRVRVGRQGEMGPDVLMVHGFGGDLTNWLFVSPLLAEGHRVHVMDLPGHGESSADIGSGDPDTLAATVESVISQIGDRPIHLVGHSLGGRVAAMVARRNRAVIGSLTLIAPAGFGGLVDREFVDGYLRAQSAGELAPVLEMLFARPEYVTAKLASLTFAQRERPGVSQALRTIADQAVLRAPDLSVEELEDRGFPVQVLWGREDRVIKPPIGLAERTNCRCLAGCGHMPHIEAPAEVSKTISDLIEVPTSS